ncbi:unnamed protein product, partial [Phaeothamnion confervicola]
SLAEARRVVVTVVNEGHTDLLLNMACSARVNHVLMDNLVVFAAQPGLEEELRARGVNAFYHEAFSAMPAGSDQPFGGSDFVRLMWLKVRLYE